MALLPKQIRLIQELKDNWFMIGRACKKVGIDRGTYYDWLEQKEFKKLLVEVEQNLLTNMEDELKNAGMNQEQWAIKFYLERKHPDYKEKRQVELEDVTLKINV